MIIDKDIKVMINLIIKFIVIEDIVGFQVVLDGIEFFLSEMFLDMLVLLLVGEIEVFWLICYIDGEVVGFCYMVFEVLVDGIWNMFVFVVCFDLQGKWLGVVLVYVVEQYLKDIGQCILIVDIFGIDDFVLICKFYVQNGYEEEVCICDFWVNGDDKVIF